MNIYVAHYDTAANVEAANDDRDFIDIREAAFPHFAAIGTTPTGQWLDDLKAVIVGEVSNIEPEDEETATPFKLSWHECPKHSDYVTAYELRNDNARGNERVVEALLVVREHIIN